MPLKVAAAAVLAAQEPAPVRDRDDELCGHLGCGRGSNGNGVGHREMYSVNCTRARRAVQVVVQVMGGTCRMVMLSTKRVRL